MRIRGDNPYRDAEVATVRKSLKKILAKWGSTGAIREVTDDKRMSRKYFEKGNPVFATVRNIELGQN